MGWSELGNIIQALIIWWGSAQYGEVKAERDQYKAITEQCAEVRKDQKDRQWKAYDDRQERERDTGEILAGSKLDAGEADKLAGALDCPGLGRALSGLADRETQRSDKLLRVRLRDTAKADRR